jgi:hypothetical protein
VLGGKVLTEAHFPNAGRTFVYAGEAIIAWQTTGFGWETVDWEHKDPSGASVRLNGVGQELDPLGGDAGVSAQTIIPDEGALTSYGSSYSAANPNVSYSVDGMRVPASDFMNFAGVALQNPLGLLDSFARASARPIGTRITGVHWGRRFDVVYDNTGKIVSMAWGHFEASLRDVIFGTESFIYNNLGLPDLFYNNLGIPNLFLVPQRTNDEFTPEQLGRFKTCLSEMFKVYYDGHKYEREGEAYFDGHSDSRAHWYSLFAIGSFRVRTDQQGYSLKDLGQKADPHRVGRGAGGLIVGYTDKRNPYVNAIANDAAVILKGREFLGLWVFELGNALAVITNIQPKDPADSRERYGVTGEAGAAFEDCVFGGRLNPNGSVTAPRR